MTSLLSTDQNPGASRYPKLLIPGLGASGIHSVGPYGRTSLGTGMLTLMSTDQNPGTTSVGVYPKVKCQWVWATLVPFSVKRCQKAIQLLHIQP